jgi:hypothetical protein
MRNLFVVIAISLLGACGVKPNPNVCCATEAQCDALGIHELRPCEVGQACSDGTCVASQCNVSTDCPAENPICMDNLCIGSCSTDDQCAGTDRPFCDEGVCVGCRSPLDCSGDTAICDQEHHECRGCIADNECASGVCIEFEGTCASADQIIYVQQFGTDTGTCTSAVPCETLTYAMQQATKTRNVVRVTGSVVPTLTTVTTTSSSLVFDGGGTTLYRPTNGPLFQINSGTTTIEGFTIVGPDADVETVSVGSATLRMSKNTTNTALISTTNGSLEVRGLEGTASNPRPMVKCTNGITSVTGSTFEYGAIVSENCLLVLQGNRFYTNSRVADAVGGKITVENNLIVQTDQFADTTTFTGSLTGSAVRFNTYVNISGVDSDGGAIYCDGTQDVSNNIFAYRSRHPTVSLGGAPCPTHHSLFDSVAVAEQLAGESNHATELPLIFANVNAKDFHLATTSPAKGVGQPNLSNVDLDGNPRPIPAGTNPDVGCYEGP